MFPPVFPSKAAHIDAGLAPEFQDEGLRGHHGGEGHTQGLPWELGCMRLSIPYCVYTHIYIYTYAFIFIIFIFIFTCGFNIYIYMHIHGIYI